MVIEYSIQNRSMFDVSLNGSFTFYSVITVSLRFKDKKILHGGIGKLVQFGKLNQYSYGYYSSGFII